MIRQFIRRRNMSMESLQGRRIHPVHAMKAEQRQTAADPWTKPTDLSHWPALGSYETTSTIAIIITQPES